MAIPNITNWLSRWKLNS